MNVSKSLTFINTEYTVNTATSKLSVSESNYTVTGTKYFNSEDFFRPHKRSKSRTKFVCSIEISERPFFTTVTLAFVFGQGELTTSFNSEA